MPVRFAVAKPGVTIRRLGLLPGQAAQRFLDRRAADLTAAYVPYDTGALARSPYKNLGQGALCYDLPYARRQYYENTGQGFEGTARGGLRGAYFFERMKADCGRQLLRETAARLGAREG